VIPSVSIRMRQALFLQAELVHLGDDPQAGVRREDVRPARQVLLDQVVLGCPGERLEVDAPLAGQRDVEGQQPHRRAVDRHRGVHLFDRDLLEEDVEVVEAVDRHADLADLGARDRVVGVVAALRRQVEGDRETGLAARQVRAVQLVGGPRARVAGVGADDPRLVARGLAVGTGDLVGAQRRRLLGLSCLGGQASSHPRDLQTAAGFSWVQGTQRTDSARSHGVE
jgi:hypothetical protein